MCIRDRDKPTGGEVLLNGKNIVEINEKEISAFRRENLGFVFQDFNLLDNFSLKDNILLPLVLSGVQYPEMEKRLHPITKRLGIEELLEKYPYEVSGGQKQRTAVARALISRPQLVLADEPTGALDSKAADELLQLFNAVNQEGQTILMVTHSTKAASHAKRVLFIKDGEVFHQLYRGNMNNEEPVSYTHLVFAEIIRVGEKAGADLILIETMSDTYELKAAVLAAKENSTLPIMATVIFDESKKMLTGASPQVVVSLLEGLGVDALGINCGLGPKQMKEIVKELLKYASIPVIVNPNAGLPRSENGKTVFDVGAEEFAEDMEEIVTMGAWFAGGCCGTTPAHIQAMVEKCKEITPVPIAPKNYTFVTSYSTAVELGGRPVIIGERINPDVYKRQI